MKRACKLEAAAAALLLSFGVGGIAAAQNGGGGAPTSAGDSSSAAAGNAAHGKQLYYAHGCYGCHGYNGETGVRDLVGTNSPIIANIDVFIAFLRARADQAPTLPSTRMPNFSANALPDADARDIFAYIRTFKLDAPSVEQIPTLVKILESAERPYRPASD
ncbi:MAG TPA: cytochrome c [Gammaproteobacteria bacterium]|nr:cytochrome c [Gammaproteobacteria bacterium]